MRYAIDSNPFIWGIKKIAHPDQQDNIRKAEEFFKWADYHKHQIIIPSLVVAEVLAPETDEVAKHYLQIITNTFIVADFDTKVAKIYSRILFENRDEIKRLQNVHEITKQQMKINHIIVATAKAYNVHALITHDNGVLAFSKGHVRLEQLKDNYNYGDHQQGSIFELFE